MLRTGRRRGRAGRAARAAIYVALVAAGTVALPIAVEPSVAGGAPSTSDGLIAFSIGVQLPPSGDDLSIPSDVYTVRPDGTGLRQLTHVPRGATAAMPAWSPAGGAIAYENNAGGDYEIWAMGARGAGNHRVLSDPGYDDLTPSWSPDGQSLVFSRCDKPFGFVAKCSLAFVRADGTGLRTILDDNHIDSRPVFSPRGGTVVFQSDRGGLQSAIWIADLHGGGLRRLTSPATRAYWPEFSADGSHVLYSSNCCIPHSDVFSIPVGGGPAVKLTNTPAGQDSAFATTSPSGASVLYWKSGADPESGTGRLVARHADGSTHTVLSGLPDVAASDWGSAPLGPASPNDALPVRSPAASRVARASRPASSTGASASTPTAVTDPAHPGRFVYFDFATGQIYAVSGAGGTPVQLTHTDDEHAALYPEIAPNGRQIAFTLIAFDGSAARIWAMNGDGSNPHQLTGDSPDFSDLQPKFTPDGKRIVFSRCADVCAIWIMNRDGTHKRAITAFVQTPTNEAVDFDPTVSPDGSKIAFTRYDADGFNARVFVAGIDGSHARAVTPPWLEGADPTFVGDGTVAFGDHVNRLGVSLWKARTDGSHLQRLTRRPYPNLDFAPSTSPDGTEIGFVSDRRYDDFCCGDIFTIRPNGTDEHRVPTGFGLAVGDLGWGRAPTSGPTAPAGTEAPARRTTTSSGLPCPEAPGSLRLVPCAAVPSAFTR